MKLEKTKEFQRTKTMHGLTPTSWDLWGPYVSERSWGTVREDYSKTGNAWNFFPRKHAHMRAFRWGEDGIAGLCDRFQLLVFSWAFWNGKDPLLKERMFGLTSEEGNHGEDVKDYYYYLDATPSHSYLKFLYKYPQDEFPYKKIVQENAKRGLKDLEYELIDTGVFDQDRYFDIFIEYAKNSIEDVCIKLEVINRSSEKATFHFLPQLIFRNRWSWNDQFEKKPSITHHLSTSHYECLLANDKSAKPLENLPFDYRLGSYYFYAPKSKKILFTENETNLKKITLKKNKNKYTKDAFHDYLVQGKNSVNPKKKGTKACVYYKVEIDAKSSKVFHFRLSNKALKEPFLDIEKIIKQRKKEADEFYRAIQPSKLSEDERCIQRQALAGMIWSKQIYLYDVGVWLQGDDPASPPPEKRKKQRNFRWRHLNSMRVFSMPDKWEYPWFAAWDLAFHCLSFMLIDLKFAKQQIWLLLFDQFMHPNGQIPAYEWEFCDVNPPVQAWTVLQIYEYEKKHFQKKDSAFLEKCFHKLLLNFSWWVNKVDQKGDNVFEGGFLGLDNITVIDRSAKLPRGALLDQTDGSGWMAMFCLNMMRIALILSLENANYESLATKFFEHYVYIAAAMRKGYWRSYDTWDAKDGWFYSALNYPNGKQDKMKIRSLVGIVPFFAYEILDKKELKQFPEFSQNFHWFLRNRPHLIQKSISEVSGNYVFGFMSKKEIEKFLTRVWDPNEFRSQFGLRSLSKAHEKRPFSLGKSRIQYEPGEALEMIKGGNSNWRGPIWFPTTYIFISVLKALGDVYKDQIQIKIKGEKPVNMSQMAEEFAKKMTSLFKRDSSEKRPIFGKQDKFQNDPHFKDHLLFFEHYHGDTGRGLGASHQTGWSGLVAKLMDEFF